MYVSVLKSDNPNLTYRLSNVATYRSYLAYFVEKAGAKNKESSSLM